jgi:uncharacterized protein YcnI
MSKVSYSPFLVAAAMLAMSSASAHISLENRQATIGADYKAVFAVPHGCGGSATIKIRVQIPEGVIAVEPMPKPGWNVDVIKGKYSGEYDYHGTKLSDGAKEVVWSGGALPGHSRDEFVISTFLTDGLKPNSTLYFPTVQECEQGVSRWIEMPAEGQADDGHEGKWPAPGVKLMPKP